MWLLDAVIRQDIERAQREGFAPTAEQQAHFATTRGALSADASRIMAVAGRSAEISVKGVLTQAPSFMAMIFGGGNTTYPEIISALAEADRNAEVDEIILNIDSPGGTVNGLFDALSAIELTATPVRAVVPGMAASAAFALAAATDKISATNRAAQFGSVGVVIDFYVNDELVSITSTQAPKKRPDVTTDEGVAMVREELDALHNIFVDAIATGRHTTAEKVNAEFGQGATLLADDALKRGMIDSVQGTQLVAVKGTKITPAASGNQPEAIKMDLKTLKSEHADVHAEAVQEGIMQERDRVGAHLTAGEMSGDMKTALACAKDGTEMSQTLSMKYLMTATNHADIANHLADDAGASAADAVAGSTEESEAAAGSAILAAAATGCGIDLEA